MSTLVEEDVLPTSSRADARLSSPKDADGPTTTSVAVQPPRSPSPNKCSICLGDLVNKCSTNSCMHQFCFGCLLEWSKVKPECPLCKSSFQTIYHNYRDFQNCDEYHVPMNTIPHLSIRLTTSDPFAQILGADIDLRRRYEMDHGYSSPLTANYLRERFGRIRQTDPRVIRILEVGPVSDRRSYNAYMSSASSLSLDNPFYSEQPEYFGSYHDGTTATATTEPSTIRGYQNRRRIYDRNQWVSPFNSTLQPGTVFFPSVEYFRTHPSAFGRINPWLYREVTVLLGLTRSRTEMGFVYDLILGLLLRYDIRSREFREMVRMYFGARVKHFQHEFYHFVLSGMRADSYDRVATYPNPRADGQPTGQGGYTGPPPVVTIGDSDEDDDIAVDDDEVMVLDDVAPEAVSEPRERRETGRSGRPRRPPPEFVDDAPDSPPNPMWNSAPRSAAATRSHRSRDSTHRRSTFSPDDLDSGCSHSHTHRAARPRRDDSPIPSPPIAFSDNDHMMTSRRDHHDRPLTEDDFPILNLRSLRPHPPGRTATVTTHESAMGEDPELGINLSGSGSRYPLRSRRGRMAEEVPLFPSRLEDHNAEPQPSTSASASRSGRRDESDYRSHRKHSHRSSKRSTSTFSADVEGAIPEFCLSYRPNLDDRSEREEGVCFVDHRTGAPLGVIRYGTHRRNDDDEMEPEANPRSSQSQTTTATDPLLLPKAESKAKASKSKPPVVVPSEDEDDCLFEGVHPIVKKPPLAVITISSEDEDEDSGKLKNERRPYSPPEPSSYNHELDDFLSWSSSRQEHSFELSPVDVEEDRRCIASRTTHDEPIPSSSRRVPSSSRSSAHAHPSSSRSKKSSASAAKTDKSKSASAAASKPAKKTKERKKRTKETKSKAFISSSESESDDDLQDCRRNTTAKRRQSDEKQKKSKPKDMSKKAHAPAAADRGKQRTRKRNLDPSPESSTTAKRLKKHKNIYPTSDSDSSSDSLNHDCSLMRDASSSSDEQERSETTSHDQSRVRSRSVSRSSSSMSLDSHPPHLVAVDLRTSSTVRFGRTGGLGNRRWESDNEDVDDNSDCSPMLLTEVLSPSDSSNSSVDFNSRRRVNRDRNLSPFSDSSHNEPDSWSSLISQSANIQGPGTREPHAQHSSARLPLEHSDSTNSSTEDEAGLNTRDQDEAEASFSERRHNFLHYLDPYNPNSSGAAPTASSIETGRRYSRSNNVEVQDLSPPNTTISGLDLRLNSPLESWRQYVRATSPPGPLDQALNNLGYWSSANDWI